MPRVVSEKEALYAWSWATAIRHRLVRSSPRHSLSVVGESIETMTLRPPDPDDSDTYDSVERVALASDPALGLSHTHAEPLARELVRILTGLIDDQHTFFIVELAGTGRFVQFIACDGDWLRGESVGNRYLDEAHLLSTSEQSELELLGWNPPETDTGDSGNYWRMWDPPDVLDAAQLAALTLGRVHHLTAADQVLLTAERAATYS